MKEYRVDLHIHTILSPCASLEMSPDNIINQALNKGLAIIGIADHNSTKQCKVIRDLGQKKGLNVLCGVEINTKEEVHCLAFFENDDLLSDFQEYLDSCLPVVKNKPELFGDQVWVDENNNIEGEEERLLIVGLDKSIDEIAEKVRSLNGIFIPAHIDRARYSISSQLGFLPPDLIVSALEVSKTVDYDQFVKKHSWVKNYSVITNSDAHMPDQIGSAYTSYLLKEASFKEIKKALSGEEGRKVVSICFKE